MKATKSVVSHQAESNAYAWALLGASRVVARADTAIVLEGIKTTITQSKTKESNYVVWQRQTGADSTVETMTLPTFTGPTAPTFAGPVLSQIPAGDFKTQVQNLGKQPGMDYVQQLAKRKDVNWQPVQLAYNQWSYDKQGLTPAGAALLAVVVSVATNGAGASLLGSAGTTTTIVNGVAVTSYTAAGLMANAAVSSLAAQASITFINNGGDIGKILKALGQSNTVKAAIAAALTAGALEKIGALDSIKPLQGSEALGDKLTLNLINAGGRALTNTAINGGSLEDALKGALIGALVDTAHGQAASQIKGLEADYIAHKLAHALAGCAAGAAAGGACKDGAIGAAVGEIVAGLMPPANGIFYTEAEKTKVLAYGQLIAGGISAYAGGNGQTAITTAETAVKNNAFFVPPLIYLLVTAGAAYTTGVGGGDPAEGLKTIGQGKDPLSKAMADGAQAAVSLSMQAYPRETTAALNLLAVAGQSVDATLSYLDSKTGKVVSTQWNSLSPDTRSMLIGAGKVTGVVLTPVGVGQIKTLVTKAPKAVTEQMRFLAQQNLVREAGAIDPKTGKPTLDTKAWTAQASNPNKPKEATGDLFGSAAMQTLFKDAQYLGGSTYYGEKGLDAVYKVNSKDIDYLFIEYKYDKSRLGSTNDGLQGSMSWATGSKRIENVVGEEISQSIYNSALNGRTEILLIQTLPDGRTNIKLIDSSGKVMNINNSKLNIVSKINNNLNKGIMP